MQTLALVLILGILVAPAIDVRLELDAPDLSEMLGTYALQPSQDLVRSPIWTHEAADDG